MLIELLLAAFPLQGGAPPFEDVSVASENGTYAAELRRAPGQERVRGPLARWQVTVFDLAREGERAELWSAKYPYDGRSERFLLTDDGTTFVHVAEPWSNHRPVVRVHALGEEVAAIEGEALGVPRRSIDVGSRGPQWFEPDESAVRLGWVDDARGSWPALTIRCADGVERRIDLAMGEVDAGPVAASPAVLPAVPVDAIGRLRAPYLTLVDAPRYALAGCPVPVRVGGNHPTPNWRLVGFELEVRGEDGRHLVLVARSAPPASGTVTATVIDGFQGALGLHGLVPGRWKVTVRGAEKEPLPDLTIDVLPERLRARMRITGGFAGVDQLVEVHSPGVVRLRGGMGTGVWTERRILTGAERDEINSVLAAMPARPRSGGASPGADHFVYALGWWAGESWREVTVDDGTARGEVLDLIETLRSLLAR